MKISIGSWAFAWGEYAASPIPFDRVVRRLAEVGYDGVEICGFPPHVTLEAYPDAPSRREFVRMLGDLGLGVSGYAADFTSANPVTGDKQKYLDLFRRNVEMCVDLGSPSIRVDSVAAPGSIPAADYEAAMMRLAEVWRQAAGIADEAGVLVVWEFEPGFAFNKPSEVIRLHEAVGHPNFKILFDTSHAYMCSVVGARQHGEKETLPGGVAEFLDRLKGRIGHIHLIDSDGTLHDGETSTHRPFGEGLIAFAALAPKLLAIPGIHWWCVDLCFWPGAWDLVETSRRFVADLLAKAQSGTA